MMILLLIIGIFIGFFIQTIIGFAGALISLPFLLFVMPLPEAISYITIFYAISSPIHIYKEWERIDKRLLKKLILSSIIGVVIGGAVLLYSQPAVLKKALGVFIILFVINKLKSKSDFKFSPKIEYVFGFLGGFFAGVFSTGGPLYVIAVKNAVIDLKTFRATMFAILGLVTLVRIPVLVFGGVLQFEQFYYVLLVLPFFILALFLGKKVYLRLNEATLTKVVLGLLMISGIMLLIK
ncbi:sulfite exporter TauE/SafE family protein [uncultured Dokdonia sp.]|uniref:sulfite exporter TauE/SafE family protein n=1 Tax=uncultured Dokdonia sp. TaxID=575653 RepID=UPI0034179B37